MKSLKANLQTLAKNGKELGKKAIGKMKETFSNIAKQVRSHRLFAKTREAKNKIEKDLQTLSQDLLGQLGNFLGGLDVKKNQIRGMGKRALNNLSENYHNMSQMMDLPALRAFFFTLKDGLSVKT